MTIVLRDDQERVRAELRAVRERARRVLLVAQTGWGKTAFASVLMAEACAEGRRSVFAVHRREIVLDTARRIREAGLRCGVVMAGEQHSDAPVQVASIQTLAARGYHPPADLLILDEAHHVVASQHQAIIDAYPAAEHLLLTATPERSDGQGLRGFVDAMIVGPSTRELVALGILAPVDVIAPERRRDALAMSPFTAWERWAGGRPTVAFLDSIDASERFCAELSIIGVRAAHIDGSTPKDSRDAILAAFAAGSVDVLCNVFVMTEGWDCARAEVLLLARGTSSRGPFRQMIGRVRRTGGRADKRATLIDLCGAVHQHGLPDEEFEYSLDGTRRTPAAAEWVRQCAVESCGLVFEGREWPEACPAGHPFPRRRPRAVELEEVARVTSVVPVAEQQAEFDRLSRVARARGWKPQAVGMQFKARFGFWPRGFRESAIAPRGCEGSEGLPMAAVQRGGR